MNNTLSISKLHIPRWNELPNIDLYLDQVVNLINNTLHIFNYDINKKEDPMLTKSMINNYVKNNLIKSPEKKLYSKNHIAKLFVVCILKQVYSMQEINRLTQIVLEDSPIAETYDNFCNLFEESLKCIFSKKNFFVADDNDNLNLIKSILVSCSYKIYVQNIISKN